MGKILDLATTLSVFNSKPKFFREYFQKSVVYHKDCLIDFNLVHDEHRFSTGYAWFCKHCGKPVFCHEHFFPKYDYFVTVSLICHLGCHAHWKMHEVESVLEALMNSVDFNLFELTDGGYVLKSGQVIRRLYDSDGNATDIYETSVPKY